MIKLNGFEVYVPPKQSIGYNLMNPHLLYDTIPSNEASIPTFPAVRQNRAIFDYWEEPQAGGYLPEMVYQHFHNGELIKEGYFMITDASAETGYKGAYTDKLGMFFGDFQKLSLREIDFGTIPLPSVLTPVITNEFGDVCCFPTIINESFFGTNGGAISYTGKINDYQAGAYSDSPVVPQFFAGYILKKIAAITGTTITGDFFTHPQWSKLILVNLRELETENIVVKNHLPDFNIVQFILELRKIPNLKFSFNSVAKTLKIDFWEDDLRVPTVRDWSKKAVFGENKTPENNTRIQISMAVDGGDGLAKDKPGLLADYISPEIIGSRNGIAKLDLKFSTLLVDTASGLPICKQEGQTSQFAQDSRTWAPRLLFWHGVESGYPRALPTILDFALFPSLMAATTWKETIAIRQRSFYLQKDFILTETDISKLDFSKKYHIDGVDYIIAQLNIGVPIRDKATALLVGGI